MCSIGLDTLTHDQHRTGVGLSLPMTAFRRRQKMREGFFERGLGSLAIGVQRAKPCMRFDLAMGGRL